MQASGSTQAGFFLRFLRNTITALVSRAVLVPVFALLAGISTPVLGVPVFPLKASANGRYLVDQNNVGFRVQGDSAWDLLVTITSSDVDTYLANRSAKGFNTLLVELVEHARYAAGSPAPANRAGNRPFLSKLGGGAYTGGGDLADLSTPNDAYFAYVDTILAKIAAKNMVALLTPLYVGYGAPTTQSSANEGWSADMNANSAANCYQYGQYVGDRYRNQKNLVWVNGGDAFGLPAAMASCVQQVMQGIKDGKGSGGSAVLQTTQWSREHLSSDDASYPVPLNSVYPSLATVASLCRSAYGRSPVLPAYVIEACYEGGSCAPTRAQLRQEGYRAALSCMGGYLFGNGPLWLFDSGWQAAMDAPGSLDWQRAGSLLDSLGWSSLVPSNLGTLAGTVLVTGGDDIASGGDVAAAASGAALLAYLPSTGTATRTITVQMGVLGAYARGRWYNPTSGAYTDLTGGAYTLANSGTHAFTTPGNNGTGTNDWVLVLDASTTPTPPVASFTASATTGSAPLALNFTNNSSGTITSDLWTFGDGTTSTAQSPAHIYNSQGVYTVSLQVTGPGGSNTQTRTNYITVTAPADTTPPAAPTNVVATASGSGNIIVTWTAATDNVGVTGYRIERCQGSGCTTFAQIASPAGTSYSDGGLSASTTYRYRVRATDAAGNLSAYSAIATATTGASADTTPPAAPTNVVATASGSGNIMVTWTAATDNVGVTGYRIERCQGSGCTTFAQIASPGGTSYSDGGLSASTTYRYRVRATDAAGNLSAYSAIATATTGAAPDTTPPTAPTNVVATASGSTNIMATWSAATDNVGVTGYRIERCQGTACSTFVQIASPSGTTYSDGGLSASTSYRYRVRASDAAGNLSAYSAIATATTGAAPDTTPPTAPTNVVATASGSTNIMATWSAATDNVGVTGYRIERCQGTACSTFVQIASPSGTTYSDGGLSASTSYRYRVRASDAAGNLSAYSAIATATTGAAPDTTPPSAPKNLVATVTKIIIGLTWVASTDNVGVTGYRIERCQGAGCSTFVQIASQSGTTYSDGGLTSGTTYCYRVRAFDAAGNLGAYSPIVSATTANTTTLRSHRSSISGHQGP